MLRPFSVTTSSQLKQLHLSCGKLEKQLMDIPWHSLTIEKTVTKL